MTFKMKGFSAFTKATDPPKKEYEGDRSSSNKNLPSQIRQMHDEVQRLNKKKTGGGITPNEENNLKKINKYLDSYYKGNIGKK